jgi:hypothetical protein
MGRLGSIKLVQLHHFIEVHVPSQESEWVFFALGASILPLITSILPVLDLEMFLQCSTFVFFILLVIPDMPHL